ncbi:MULTISPECIES: hypothetical protein [Halorussus]|uniref:hypothetical protein n=1 Tax=Halorussus TaxID=1070314 RepID=UPI000E218A3D|nr:MULTISPECIES: hypothetical protein [Halorussus]NHN59634.1 hypothetical protein [Halorussus sp. JP-T4]
MVGTNSGESPSRRSVLKRTAGALALGGAGLAAGGGAGARRRDVRQAAAHRGVTCGGEHSEGSEFTVERRCERTDCDTIRLTGVSPACAAAGDRLYADLPGTEPTVWTAPRNGEVPPGTYRVVRTERCESAAGDCDGRDLYRLAFRPTEE